MVDANVEAIVRNAEALHEVWITLDGRDVKVSMDNLNITMDSTERDILTAVRGLIMEENGVDINDEYGNVAYVVRKALNTDVIHVYPKPVAG